MSASEVACGLGSEVWPVALLCYDTAVMLYIATANRCVTLVVQQRACNVSYHTTYLVDRNTMSVSYLVPGTKKVLCVLLCQVPINSTINSSIYEYILVCGIAIS